MVSTEENPVYDVPLRREVSFEVEKMGAIEGLKAHFPGFIEAAMQVAEITGWRRNAPTAKAPRTLQV